MQDAALEYATRYGMQTLPCEPGGKAPLIALVPHGVKDATTDTAKIKLWWDQYPDANIGIAGGNGLLCIDLDLYKNPNAGAELERLIGCPLPATRSETTPGGGLHYFYKVPTNQPLTGCDPLPGVELRYEGRYVVTAPSINASGAYKLVNDWYPVNAPVGLVELLRAPSTVGRLDVEGEPLPDSAYFQGALEAIYEEAAVRGQRSEQVWHIMCRVAELDCTPGQIWTAVANYPAAQQIESEKRGWLEADFQRFMGKKWPEIQQREPEVAKPKNDWGGLFLHGGDFALDVDKEVPSVWGHGNEVLWAQGEALMINGPQGVGKTTLEGQLIAARLGLISELLNLPVSAGKGRVLFLAMDRPMQIQRSLNRFFRLEWREVLNEKLVIWKGPPPQDLARNTGLLLEMAQHVEADTVFVDSLKDAAIGLKDDEVGAAYNRARQTAIQGGVEVCELHHQVKRSSTGGPPMSLEDVYGSIWLTAGAGSVILLWGQPGDPIVDFRHLKQPSEEIGPFKIAHNHTLGTSTIYQANDLLTLVNNAKNGLTPKEAASVLFDTRNPTTAQVEKARRKLDGYANANKILCAKGTRGGAPTVYLPLAHLISSMD